MDPPGFIRQRRAIAQSKPSPRQTLKVPRPLEQKLGSILGRHVSIGAIRLLK
jgi:hypothetical protein